MTILKKISEKNATGRVKKIFDTIKKTRKIKKIPNFWKTLAVDPDTLERTWESLQQVMKNGALNSVTKEMWDICYTVNDIRKTIKHLTSSLLHMFLLIVH